MLYIFDIGSVRLELKASGVTGNQASAIRARMKTTGTDAKANKNAFFPRRMARCR